MHVLNDKILNFKQEVKGQKILAYLNPLPLIMIQKIINLNDKTRYYIPPPTNPQN